MGINRSHHHHEKGDRGIAARAGHWSARHRAVAIAGWLVFVLLAATIGGSVGTKKLTNSELRTGESAAAARALDHAGFSRPAAEQVLVQRRGSGNVLSSDGRSAIGEVVRAVTATGRVQRIRSPLAPGNGGQLSRDGRSALVLFNMKGKAETAHDRVQPVLDQVARIARAHPDLRIEQFGTASAGKALDDTIGKDFARAEGISIPLTFAILLIVFGAVLAALLPLMLALSAVMAGTGLLAVASHAFHTDGSASTMLLLVGLAVGVDYSLFYLRRTREERAAGRSTRDAIDAAAATSGRSVLVSGLTVIVAMAAMFLTGQGTFIGMAEATDPRSRRRGARLADSPSRHVVAARRQRRAGPDPVARQAAAAPTRPRTEPAVGRAARACAEASPGHDDALRRVAARHRGPGRAPAHRRPHRLAGSAQGPADHADLPASPARLPRRPRAGGGRAHRTQRRRSGGDGANRGAPPRSARHASDVRSDHGRHQPRAHGRARLHPPGRRRPERRLAQRARRQLRERIIPHTVARVATAKVSGATATSVDTNARMKARTPLVFAFVVALAFLLMLWSFRSVVIAATGVVLNLLSVAAAYGALVADLPVGLGQVAPRAHRHRDDRRPGCRSSCS